MPAGRKPKYRTAKQMADDIEKYFAECDSYTYLTDANGNPVMYKGNPVYDKAPEPYTITGLTRFLGFTDFRYVKAYMDKDVIPEEDEHDRFLAESYEHPTFRKVIKDAMLRVEEYREKALYSKDTVTGAKFVLENNGWNTKKEVDVSVKAVGAIVTEEEAIKRLKELGFEEKK